MEVCKLGVLLSVYRQFARSENKSPRTIQSTIECVGHFNDFIGGCDDINTVTDEDLRRYIRHLQSRFRWDNHPSIKPQDTKLSPHSIAHDTRTIRAFWSWANREGFLKINAFERVPTPRAPRQIVPTLTVEAVRSFIKAIPRKYPSGYRDRTITIALYGTGVRVSELLQLKLGDVDFDIGQIRVMGKGSRERFVHISASVFKALLKYHSQWRPKVASPYFFVNSNGRPPSRFNIAHRFRLYGNKAGITSKCSPHVLRHSFAVQYLRNGGDAFTLQKLLGHSTMDMTRHYVEVSQNDLEEKIKLYSPAENLNIQI